MIPNTRALSAFVILRIKSRVTYALNDTSHDLHGAGPFPGLILYTILLQNLDKGNEAIV